MAEQERGDPTARALADLDARIAANGLEIWLGAEPTFTDRFSLAPEWHNQALGPEKEQRARHLVAALALAQPGGALLRTLGRQYPGEATRRWSYGLLARRDGAPLWAGPPDPLIGGQPADSADIDRFATGIEKGLVGCGLCGRHFSGSAAHEHRILLAMESTRSLPRPEEDARLLRPSVHCSSSESANATDTLAAEGLYLLIVHLLEEEGNSFAAVELPAVGNPQHFLTLLELIEHAGAVAGVAGLVLRGYAPPARELLRWTTVTPDPGVVEINQAPCADLCELLRENRRLFAAAEMENLVPFRLHYNGEMEDSGGGGQVSIGGPTPERSPFALTPHLLTALVRYFNQHPAMSYWFAPQYVGAFSQAPRPDEGIRDLLEELELTLDYLATQARPDLELFWRSLNPFLRDVSGNAHRSELNIEKLWSPAPRLDGIAGVVELRAFRMARTAESMAARAALVRALTAMLMRHPFDQPLIYWGDQLHDRFSLPFYVEQDLDRVLEDLVSTGFGLDDPLVQLLRSDHARTIARLRYGETQVTLSTALEFWPQVGDTTSQPADSRLVDASTGRLEIRLQDGAPDSLQAWELAINGYAVPMRLEQGRAGPLRVIGLRYRRYKANHALHPAIEPQLPIHMAFYNRRSGDLVTALYYEWRPDGGAYPGLPDNIEEAELRRSERVVCDHHVAASTPTAVAPPARSLTDHCFDLRRT